MEIARNIVLQFYELIHQDQLEQNKMSELAIKLSLYDHLIMLPENLTGEILNGQLHTQPRPAGPHALVESSLEYELFGPFHKGRGGPGGWWIIIKPEVHFVRDAEVCVPDIAGWRRERMPLIPSSHRFEVVPGRICPMTIMCAPNHTAPCLKPSRTW